MKKLLLTTIALSLFQTPVFGQVNLDNDELYLYGKFRGVLFCTALQHGAKNVQDIARFKDMLDNPEINLADSIYEVASPAQREYFFNGWVNYTKENCPAEMNKLRRNYQ